MRRGIILVAALLMSACAYERDGIRYDDTIGVPAGYKDLCAREPDAPECGGRK